MISRSRQTDSLTVFLPGFPAAGDGVWRQPDQNLRRVSHYCNKLSNVQPDQNLRRVSNYGNKLSNVWPDQNLRRVSHYCNKLSNVRPDQSLQCVSHYGNKLCNVWPDKNLWCVHNYGNKLSNVLLIYDQNLQHVRFKLEYRFKFNIFCFVYSFTILTLICHTKCI